MHQFKPKMTGGHDQSSMGMSPEAHAEWLDKDGKHVIDTDLGKAPYSNTASKGVLERHEKTNMKKNEDTGSIGSRAVSEGSHGNPFHKGKKSTAKSPGEKNPHKKALPPKGGMKY